MAYRNIIKLYANLVYAGVRTINEVPDGLREEVSELVKEKQDKEKYE